MIQEGNRRNINISPSKREYGSGGTQIARETAERCKLHCYGREILEAVADEQNIPISQIEAYEENVSNSLLYSINLMAKTQNGDPDLLTQKGHIYVAEQQTIKRFADAGSAIFVGHCAAEALKDRKELLKVFIRADHETKVERAIREYGVLEHSIESTLQKFDRKRERYYYANTTHKWHGLENYDMVLDSSNLGVSGCVDVLEMVIKHEFVTQT